MQTTLTEKKSSLYHWLASMDRSPIPRTSSRSNFCLYFTVIQIDTSYKEVISNSGGNIKEQKSKCYVTNLSDIFIRKTQTFFSLV